MIYDRNDVAIAFHAEHCEVLNPGEARLETFSNSMYQRFDAEITRQAPRFEIPLSAYNRSKLALLAVLSPGPTEEVQVRDACTYFAAVRIQPPRVIAGVVAPYPVPTDQPG